MSLAVRLLVVTALLAPALAYQGTTRAGLTGRLVREGEETHPVRRARVVLTGRVTVDADTDTDGVFRIADLPDGTYRVSVKKTGFVLVDPSAVLTVPSSRAIETIAMRPGAVITGRLLNMFGKPAPGVDVTLSFAASDSAPPKDDARLKATTNDEGTFRFHTLQPGVYNLFAASFYYPGKAARADAEAVRVNAGQTVTIDFAVPWDPPGNRQPPIAICETARLPSNMKDGTGRIAGRISSADATQSMEKVAVQLSSVTAGRPVACAETGANGAFVFTGVAAGRYFVSATYHPSGAAALVGLSYGQRTHQDLATPITIASGQQLNTVDIMLPAFVTVSGQVFDEFGDPAPDVTVGLLQPVVLDGKARLFPFAGDATTNDMGAYRVPTVPSGTYSVIALSGPFGAGGILAGPAAPQRDTPGFAVTYYPGTTIARDAQVIDVIDAPQQISFALVPADLGTLRGRAVDRFGQPAANVLVSLYQLQDGDIRVIVPAHATADKNGAFIIRNVPMGTYLLEVLDLKRYGNLTVAMTERDAGDLRLAVREPISIRGRLIVDGGSDPPSRRDVYIEPYHVDWAAGPFGSRIQSSIADDWTFAIPRVLGPARLRVYTPEPWVVQSITAHGRDVTDTPIDPSSGDVTDVEIRLARGSKTVTGRVVDQDGRGVPAAFVLIFASNPSLWSYPSRHITTALTDNNGLFEAPPLPATTYVAVPFARSPRIDWMNPEYLATLTARGEPFTVREGAPAYVQLRLNTRR